MPGECCISCIPRNRKSMRLQKSRKGMFLYKCRIALRRAMRSVFKCSLVRLLAGLACPRAAATFAAKALFCWAACVDLKKSSTGTSISRLMDSSLSTTILLPLPSLPLRLLESCSSMARSSRAFPASKSENPESSEASESPSLSMVCSELPPLSSS